MITNINLAVDCMGSETSLNEILEGINESALRNENLFFTLFGKSVDIEKVLKDVNDRLSGKVVTKISLLKNYCPAEEYHQKYLEKR